METEKKYALLIDADNVSPKYMDLVLRETKTLGDVSIRRIYGDWTEIGKTFMERMSVGKFTDTDSAVQLYQPGKMHPIRQ